MRKLTILFAALTLCAGLWAANSVITFTSTDKLYPVNIIELVNDVMWGDGAKWAAFKAQYPEFKDVMDPMELMMGINSFDPNAFLDANDQVLNFTIDYDESTHAGTITVNGELVKIASYAFEDCGGLTSITLPEGVTSIGGSAFSECSALTSVILPESLSSIGTYGFDRCPLSSVTIPAGVTTIGEYAFALTGLTSVTIPAGVTTIGEGAFYECSSLASVTFLGNACQEAIGEDAFYNVGNPDPALLTLHGTWAKENLPDEDGNWYGGKFELSEDPSALPTLFGDGVKGNKFMHNGQLIIRKGNKHFNALGAEVK